MRLRQLIISNASVIDIAADLGRTVKAVRARAHALRIALGRSRFRVGKSSYSLGPKIRAETAFTFVHYPYRHAQLRRKQIPKAS